MSNAITAIIVDDEAHARRTLETMLQAHCPEVQVKEQCPNVPQAVLAIKNHQPQLVFLDIEMPEFNGFELFKFFDEINFEIIFVTAYSEYAIRAFELSAVDYLLKPVQQEKLKAAIAKVNAKHANHQLKERLELLQSNLHNEEFTRIALPVTDGLLFVEVANILYVEADGAYSKVYLNDGSCVTVSRKIKFFEEVLTKRKPFFRTHRSYVVNLNFVRRYNRLEGYIILENKTTLPVSKERKKEFEESFSEIRIGR